VTITGVTVGAMVLINLVNGGNKMTLREKQSRFAWLISHLIQVMYMQGYEVTFACGFHLPWPGEHSYHHSEKSYHKTRLALDINLFKDGVYLTSSEAHRYFGEYWESLDPGCRWGGTFGVPDGNHYEYNG
jgi:hypothetical protein